MFKLFRIKCTATGNEYELPLEAIIAHRIQSLVTSRDLKPTDGTPEAIQAFMQGPIQALQDEVNAEFKVQTEGPWSVAERDILREYAAKIPWAFVVPHTRMVKFNAPDYNLVTDMEWVDAYDEPKPLEDLPDGLHSGMVPIDFFLAMLGKNNNNLSMSVMLDEGQRKNALIVVFRGDHDQVEACEVLLGQLAAQMRQFPHGKPAGKQYPH